MEELNYEAATSTIPMPEKDLAYSPPPPPLKLPMVTISLRNELQHALLLMIAEFMWENFRCFACCSA